MFCKCNNFVCDIELGEYGNGYYVQSNNLLHDGTGIKLEGHSLCLYGPFDEYQTFFSREYTTDYISTKLVHIYIDFRVWHLCDSDNLQYLQLDFYDITNNNKYTFVMKEHLFFLIPQL